MKTTTSILFTREEIQEMVTRLAGELNRYYADLPAGETILVVGILKGAFIFLADLARELNFPLQIEFMRIASYGNAHESSGNIQLLLQPGLSLEGRRVLIVEDIIDTGQSMAFLYNYFHSHHVAEVVTAVLLDKRARRSVDVSCQFIGHEVEDKFLGGYGMDGGESFQNIPWIFAVEPIPGAVTD